MKLFTKIGQGTKLFTKMGQGDKMFSKHNHLSHTLTQPAGNFINAKEHHNNLEKAVREIEHNKHHYR